MKAISQRKQGLSDTVITFQHGVTSLWGQKGLRPGHTYPTDPNRGGDGLSVGHNYTISIN